MNGLDISFSGDSGEGTMGEDSSSITINSAGAIARTGGFLGLGVLNHPLSAAAGGSDSSTGGGSAFGSKSRIISLIERKTDETKYQF
jgi:hypothetical protein